ncbi:MAG: hypothetical protein JW863_05135 [Chitinispirillaceae bacterium]|nr:hypothetical protein [Chitinispirillaceae bacterium]
MHCTHCNRFLHEPAGISCPYCGTRIRINDEGKTGETEARFPWDSLFHDSNPLRLLTITATDALFHPSRFYRDAAARSRKLLPALLYMFIIGGIGITGAWVSTRWFPAGDGIAIYHSLFFDNGMISPAALATSPLLLSLELLLTALYVFITLRLSRFRRCAFSDLIRILCYTETPMLLQIIPFIGTFLALPLWIYSLLTALHALHEESRLRILFQLLLPLIVAAALALIIILSGILGGIIAGTGMLPDWKHLIDRW